VVERGSQVAEPSRHVGLRLIIVFLALFGVAFAVTGLLVAMPKPQIPGTCGPGKSSESSIVAFFDPGSIGAGREPATSHATERAQWMAFVGECQAIADSRVLATFAILVLSASVAVVGTAWARRSMRRAPPAIAQLH
jgi:hypothetical protein